MDASALERVRETEGVEKASAQKEQRLFPISDEGQNLITSFWPTEI